ncbi:unnamed protein product [Microthlaspi erraticum]|uniref:Uncharacterized protein n=1 Tax=Microthlaspi erraticum TaxID=1685480 RepID=A0A6D2LCH4_9BRAS|nr:unnamed protein product [Microthlaspi erraticum]
MDCCLSESQFPSTPFGPPLLMFVSQLSDTILSTAGIAACTPPTSYAPWMGNFILASFYVQVTMGGSISSSMDCCLSESCTSSTSSVHMYQNI